MTRSTDGTVQAKSNSFPSNADEQRPSGQPDELVNRLLEAMQSDQEVRGICLEHGLWPHLKTFVKSVQGAFHPIHEMHAEVDVDPDTDERRIVVDITADAPVAQLLHQYDQFTRTIVREVPAEKRDWMRLAFQPLRDE